MNITEKIKEITSIQIPPKSSPDPTISILRFDIKIKLILIPNTLNNLDEQNQKLSFVDQNVQTMEHDNNNSDLSNRLEQSNQLIATQARQIEHLKQISEKFHNLKQQNDEYIKLILEYENLEKKLHCAEEKTVKIIEKHNHEVSDKGRQIDELQSKLANETEKYVLLENLLKQQQQKQNELPLPKCTKNMASGGGEGFDVPEKNENIDKMTQIKIENSCLRSQIDKFINCTNLAQTIDELKNLFCADKEFEKSLQKLTPNEKIINAKDNMLDELTQSKNENAKLYTQINELTNKLGQMTNDSQIITLENNSKQLLSAKIKKLQSAIKHRDAIIIKLEHILDSEKSNTDSLLQQMQNQLTQLQKSVFEKNNEIERLNGKLTEATIEIDKKIEQINKLEMYDRKEREKLIQHKNHIAGIYTELEKRAEIVSQLDSELSEKAEELKNLYQTPKQLEISRQDKIIQILRMKQERCHAIRVQQFEKIAQLKSENIQLREKLMNSEQSMCSMADDQMNEPTNVCCVVEELSETRKNYDHQEQQNYFHEYRKVKKYY